ncbi:MAG: amidohydrolase family protein [Actinomycetota bacterium]
MTDPGVVDLHAHVVLEGAFGSAGAYGPELGDDDGTPFFRVGEYLMKPSPYRGSVFMDVDLRLGRMDTAGIAVQMLSPNPLSFCGGIGTDEAVALARATNDAMTSLVADRTRLLGAAQLPIQSVHDACVEAERAKELGLVAVYVGTDYGTAWDSPDLDPLYRTLVDLDLPLFIHPATNDGRTAAPDGRLHRFGLDLVVGYTYEETLTTAAFVLGGVLDRHPDLDVCISHGGGAAAFLVDRFDSMSRFRRQPAAFAEGLRRLWFDAHMEDGAARDLLVDIVGLQRLVYGTNFGGWDTPPTADDFDRSLTPNAERLLRLDLSARRAERVDPDPAAPG